MNPPDYLNPNIPSHMKRVSIPVVEATNESLRGYGCLVDAPDHFKVEINFDGSCGLYIHPDVWHEGVFSLSGTQRFFDKQGAVHARVSVDFPREFGCLLDVDLRAAHASAR
jgi:hypothetical protein